MKTGKTIPEKRSSEEKIKLAAKAVFLKKGYAATRTRDIAEAAGINIALLNYYFRSKEKLFELIMEEKLLTFFGKMIPDLYNESSSLEEKVVLLANGYIDMLLKNPDLPLFVLSEIKSNPGKFISMISKNDFMQNSVLSRQLAERNKKIKPAHFMMNILSLCVFPFIMQPVLTKLINTNKKEFEKLMEERRTLIPLWMNSILQIQ